MPSSVKAETGKSKRRLDAGSGSKAPSTTPAKAAKAKKGISFSPTTDFTRQTLEAMEMREVWVTYQSGKSLAIRNFLLEKFYPLVRYNAERIHTRLPDEVDVDDLAQAGLFGLKDAIDSFELDRGVKFETYCASRIRGAILDELRSMDWVPRLVRQRTAKVNAARNRFLLKHGRAPTEDELAQLLGADAEEFKKLSRDSRAASVISISRKVVGGDGSRELHEIDVIRDETQSNPLTEARARPPRTHHRGLSRERLIVILYYFEEMTMKEIGPPSTCPSPESPRCTPPSCSDSRHRCSTATRVRGRRRLIPDPANPFDFSPPASKDAGVFRYGTPRRSTTRTVPRLLGDRTSRWAPTSATDPTPSTPRSRSSARRGASRSWSARRSSRPRRSSAPAPRRSPPTSTPSPRSKPRCPPANSSGRCSTWSANWGASARRTSGGSRAPSISTCCSTPIASSTPRASSCRTRPCTSDSSCSSRSPSALRATPRARATASELLARLRDSPRRVAGGLGARSVLSCGRAAAQSMLRLRR